MDEKKADVWYEVRQGAAGEGWQAVYCLDPGAKVPDWYLVCVLPPGHLRVLGEAVNKAVRERVEPS